MRADICLCLCLDLELDEWATARRVVRQLWVSMEPLRPCYPLSDIDQAEMHVRHTVRLVLGALGCAIAVAACGSSAKPRRTADLGSSSQGTKYSDCMRDHGVPAFPDLNANGSVSLPSSINPDSPAFQSAEGTCASLRPQGAPPPPITVAQQKSFDANAKCMRTHGIPDFPDPTFGPGGHGLGVQFPSGAPHPTLAALTLANAKCAHVGSPLPLRGVAASG